MVKDAEAHANEDAQRKDAAEARNRADHSAYSIEKQLQEHGDKLTDDEKTAIEDKVTALRKLLTEEASPEDLTKATEDMLTASQVLGQKIYEASAQAAAEGEAEAASDDDVVEAEIVDEDGEES